MQHATPHSIAQLAAGTRVARSRRAFTLIELLVAVGALAFIAAGIATIFESTGRTIRAGKRLSTFSSYANLIQQQMKSDFAAMTRDGFLVIRNEYAGGDTVTNNAPDSIATYADDTNPRPRRVDQIMFFAKGSFASARESLDPAFTPRSDVARIYYGHGQRESSTNDRFLRPELNDNNAPAIGQRSATRLGYKDPGGTNPNLYASDWTLLRHVTLIRQPQTSPTAQPSNKVLNTYVSPPSAFADGDVQIALQPAASNIFRRLLVLFPDGPSATALPSIRSLEFGTSGNAANPPSPVFSSGLVDIATTDLTEIRQVVMTADTWPVTGLPVTGAGTLAGPNFWTPASNNRADGNNAGPDGKYKLNDLATVNRMHAWMDDAWPSDTVEQNALQRDRIRAEPTPVNFIGVGRSPSSPLSLAERRADQAMLMSSNFLPHCTEFIVEWSFGDTFTSDPSDTNYPNVLGRDGQTIWHGMLRRTSTGQSLGTQSPSPGDKIPAVFPYLDKTDFPSSTLGKASAYSVPIRLRDGTSFDFPVRTLLIHGEQFTNANRGGTWTNISEPLTSYFGYTDPYFNPDQDADGTLDGDGDATVETIPWTWPKLIRVTMTLTDPNDPKIEQTFQFVFDVPEPKN